LIKFWKKKSSKEDEKDEKAAVEKVQNAIKDMIIALDDVNDKKRMETAVMALTMMGAHAVPNLISRMILQEGMSIGHTNASMALSLIGAPAIEPLVKAHSLIDDLTSLSPDEKYRKKALVKFTLEKMMQYHTKPETKKGAEEALKSLL